MLFWRAEGRSPRIPHKAVRSTPDSRTPSAPASEWVSVSPLANPWTGDQVLPRDHCSPKGSMPQPERNCCEHVEWPNWTRIEFRRP